MVSKCDSNSTRFVELEVFVMGEWAFMFYKIGVKLKNRRDYIEVI